MSRKNKFFLVYVSLVALANSAYAASGSSDAVGVIQAFGDILGKFAPKDDKDNTEIQGGLMNLGSASQQGMQNGVQSINFQNMPNNFYNMPNRKRGGNFADQGNFDPQKRMFGTSTTFENTEDQSSNPWLNQPGTSTVNPNGAYSNGYSAFDSSIVPGNTEDQSSNPWINQPGTPMMSANGQPIMDPSTGKPVLVPQIGTMTPGTPMMGANGQRIMDPSTGQPVLVPQLNMQTNSMGSIVAGPIDERVLMDPNLNPALYAQILEEAQKDKPLEETLAIVKEELNEHDAKLVRATLLKPILLRMNLKQVQEGQKLQAEQMQQQQAMMEASSAARAAEQQRTQTMKAEIARLEQKNNQLITDLKHQGVSIDEINSILARSRQDGARVAGNAAIMPGAMNTNVFSPGAQSQSGGFPAFPEMGGAQSQSGGFPAFPEMGGAQSQSGGFPAFPEMDGAQSQSGGFPALPEMDGAQSQSGGFPAFPEMDGLKLEAGGFPDLPKMDALPSFANG